MDSRHRQSKHLFILVAFILAGLGAMLLFGSPARSANLAHQPNSLSQGTWERLDFSSLVGSAARFGAVDGVDADNIYFYYYYGLTDGFIYYDGIDGTLISSPGTIVTRGDFMAAAPEGLYAIHGYNAKISLYNGTQWTLIARVSPYPDYSIGPTECRGSSVAFAYSSIWSIGANDLMVMGTSRDGTCVWRYRNGAWQLLYSHPEQGAMLRIYGVHPDLAFSTGKNKLYYFDGTAWYEGGSLPWPHVDSVNVWGPSLDSIYVPGTGGIYHTTDRGTTWTKIPLPYGASKTYNSLWGTSDNDLYVASADNYLYHYDGTSWSEFDPGFHGSMDWIKQLWGVENVVYAIGNFNDQPFVFQHIGGPSPTSTPTPQACPTSTPTPTPQYGIVTETPTPTPQASPSPTPTPVPNYRFWGDVTTSTGAPVRDALIELRGYNQISKMWDLLAQFRTNARGKFFLFRWENSGYRVYRLVVHPPTGYTAVRAEAPPPARVIDSRTIEYQNPPSGYYTHNRFILAQPTPTPTPTPGIPILILGGGGNAQQRCPDEEEWPVQRLTMSVNEVSDWQVSRIEFNALGSGDELKDVKEARLYRGDRLLGRATYSQDNGTIAFNVNIHIPAGSAVSVELRYVLDPDKMEWDDKEHKLAKIYQTVTSVTQVSALPLNGATDYQKLPLYPIIGPEHQVARVWNTSLDPWQGYGVIQVAVDAATTQDGHTLGLCPATFQENVRVSKALTIQSLRANERATVLAANAEQSTFTITRTQTSLVHLIVGGATGNGAAGVLATGEAFNKVITQVTLRENTFQGNHYGVFFRYVDDSVIEGNDILDNASYGVYVGDNDATDEAQVVVRNNTLRNNGAGIVVDEAWSTQVRDNTIEGAAAQGALRAAANLPDAPGDGIHLRDVSYAMLQNNHIVGQQRHGLVIEDTSAGGGLWTKENQVQDNLIEDNGGWGVLLHGAQATTLTNNRLNNNVGGGVRLEATENTRLQREGDGVCTLNSLEMDGPATALLAVVDNVRDTRVRDCTFTARQQDVIIHMAHSTGLAVGESQLTGGRYGVHLQNASQVTLFDNCIQEQEEEGLRCEDSSKIELRLPGNQFENAGVRALAFYRCTPRRGYVNPLSALRITGANTETALYFEGSHGFRTSDATVEHLRGPAVVITATQGVELNRLTVNDAPLGVSVTQAQDIAVRNGTFTNTRDGIVRANHVQNLRLEGNTARPAGATSLGRSSAAPLQGGGGAPGFHLMNINGGQVKGNTVRQWPDDGLVIEQGQNLAVENNTLQNLGGRGVVVREGQNVTLATNTITDNDRGGVLIWKGQGHQVNTNIIQKNKGYGVLLYEVTEAAVNQNEVHDTAAGSPDPDVSDAVTGQGHGLLQIRGEKNTWQENVVRRSAGDGVHFSCFVRPLTGLHSCTGSNLVKNDIAANTGDGIVLSWAEWVWLKGNRVENNGEKGIYLYENRDSQVRKADDGTATQIQGHQVGIWIQAGSGNSVWDSVITGAQKYGILFKDTERNDLSDNEIRDAGLDGIRMENSPHNRGREGSEDTSLNKIYNPGRYGIVLEKSPENKLAVNWVENAGLDGILLVESHKTVVDTNRIMGSNEYGLVLERTNEAQVTGNTLKGGKDHAIVLRLGSQKNRIAGNQVGEFLDVGNDGDGVHLEYAHKNVIEQNQIGENKGHGVFLSVTEGNVVRNNTIQGNHGDGIHSEASRKMSVLANVLEDNRGNAIAFLNSRVNTRAKRTMIRDNRAFISPDGEGGKNGILVDNANYLYIMRNDLRNFPEYGIYVNHVEDTHILHNILEGNCGGIYVKDSRFLPGTVGFNRIHNSWCLFTGIHLENASPDIVGNEVSGSAWDGIIAEKGSAPEIRHNAIVNNGRDGVRAMSGSTPVLRENTLADNAGLAVNNADASVTVDARGNWWGDAGGPGGQGPGSGDEVSAGVDYGDWLNAPAGLSVLADPLTQYVLPGGMAQARLSLQSLGQLPITVTVTGGDGQGWLPVGYQRTVVITEAAGALLPITVTVPADAAPGTVNVVSAAAEGDGLSAHTAFTVTVAAAVSEVSIQGPAALNPGEVVTYTVGITPTDAAEVTYLWWPEPRAGQGDASAAFAWDMPGLYTLRVEVEQLGRVTRAEKVVAVRGERRWFVPWVVR